MSGRSALALILVVVACQTDPRDVHLGNRPAGRGGDTSADGGVTGGPDPTGSNDGGDGSDVQGGSNAAGGRAAGGRAAGGGRAGTQGGAGGAAAGTLGVAGAGSPITMTFGERSNATNRGVTQDADLQSSFPNMNYGATADIASDGEPPRQGVLRFDLSSVDPTSTVISATLRLWTLDCTDCQASAGTTVQFFRILEPWTEAGVTWNSRSAGLPWSAAGVAPPSRDTLPLGDFAPARISTEYTVTLPVMLVQGWIATPERNYGLLMRTNPFGVDGVNFWSSEYGTVPDKQPLLSVVLRVN